MSRAGGRTGGVCRFAYAFSGRTELVARTGVFYVGFALVLVPLGAGSGALASVVTLHRQVLIVAAGSLIIALGIVQILGGGWSLQPAARFQQKMVARGTWASTVGLGAAYGLAGFCSGPILGAVLTVAAAGGQPLRGAALLAVYALGMTVPLFLLAVLWQRFDLGRRSWLRGREFSLGPLRLHTTSTVSGLLFIAVGVVFLLFDGVAVRRRPRHRARRREPRRLPRRRGPRPGAARRARRRRRRRGRVASPAHPQDTGSRHAAIGRRTGSASAARRPRTASPYAARGNRDRRRGHQTHRPRGMTPPTNSTLSPTAGDL